MLCTPPPRQPAVGRHCLDPLQELLPDKAKERLEQAFGESLPPETTLGSTNAAGVGALL